MLKKFFLQIASLQSSNSHLKAGAVSERSELAEITIRGLGVIEEATLELGPGFTVLTGETGAGKTMVLTALSLVLGGKADSSLVRQGRDRLVASATFKVTPRIEEISAEKGARTEDGELILTRTLNSEGKSRASAGGVSVPASVLSDLGQELIEIHGQVASMSITKVAKQREILDRYAGEQLRDVCKHYKIAFDDYNNLKAKIASLKSNAAGREKEIVALQEFSDAFKKIKPNVGEAGRLATEITRLSSIESLRVSVGESVSLLISEESGVVDALAIAKKNLEVVAEKDPLLSEILAAVTDAFFQLSEAAQSAHLYLDDLEADPLRLEVAQARRAELIAFLKRYSTVEGANEQIAELLTRFEHVSESIEDLMGFDDRLAQMEEELELLFQHLSSRAQILSEVRRDFAEQLSSSVTEEIQMLSMPHTRFFCVVSSLDFSQKLSPSVFTSNGVDEVAMLLQAHRDGPLVQVAKGASGGELSRVMLALEVVLAESEPVGTYIFDEVDAGVGGKAAVEVGRRLRELSQYAQVIVVTHLPQVAAWADSHFVVRKNEDGAVSLSDVVLVTGDLRIEEIARMLAGHEDSQSAREHAAELLALRG
jgi:DNA repair protein RecN (Recombination protein N)